MTKATAFLLAAALLGLPSVALAGDPAAGRATASGQCAVCHGVNGISQHPEAPNLAGQVEMYLVKALEDFRSGARKNEMMTVVTQNITDDAIANLAAWYSSVEISVKDKP